MSYQNLNVAEFEQMMAEAEDAVLLDVRTEPELAEGFIPGHQMINFMAPDFAEQVSKLDPAKSYFIYCRSGGRSGQACMMMASLGFSKLFNLAGGIQAWNAAHPA
ncbi:MAG: rhodanese-like domain-containing protein [Microscillaceae bacterium]